MGCVSNLRAVRTHVLHHTTTALGGAADEAVHQGTKGDEESGDC